MGLRVLQFRQQLPENGLLLRRKGDGAGVKGYGGEQVNFLILLARRKHAFFAQAVQRCLGDAHLVQLARRQGTLAQRLHRRQLPRSGFRGGGQLAGQGVQPLGRAGQPALHHRTPVFHRRAVLCAVGYDRLDRLKPGAEGALLQKAHQFHQVGGQAGFLGRGVQQGFQVVGRVLDLLHIQNDRHTRFIAAPKGYQHHTAGPDPARKAGRHAVGIQPVKVDVGIVYRRLGNLQAHSAAPCLSLNWMMEYRLSAHASTWLLTICSS